MENMQLIQYIENHNQLYDFLVLYKSNMLEMYS